MDEGRLTHLGTESAAASSNADVARLWCAWLQSTSDIQLGEINFRLLAAKRVFPQFWRLKEEVRTYFLDNAHSPRLPERHVLQTIELLCNAREVVQELSLDDIRTLSQLLDSPHIPEYIRKEIRNYFENKGTRSWDQDDRQIVPLAWREVQSRK